MHAVVEALMRGRMTERAWCTSADSTPSRRKWIWATCLRELRIAAVLLARLRAGHADLRFLSRNIQVAMG